MGGRTTEPTWLLAEGAPDQAGFAVNHFVGKGYMTRLLRGEKLASENGMFAQFAAAFQFPWYFGQNWHAFDECFGEIELREVGSGLAVVIMNGGSVVGGDPKALRDLVTSLRYARDSWQNYDRVPAFVVVVQIEEARLELGRAAWEEAGVHFDEFEPG